MRLWAATVVLTSSGLIAFEPINSDSVFAQKPVISPAVNKADFGVERVNAQRQATFIPTTKVPFKEGSRYGWQIQLKDYKGEVTWREILRLPKRPETWGTNSGENFSISPNGQDAVTKRTVTTTDGVIKNFWTITPGDPVGKHRIEVYVGDRLISAFDFEIIASNQKGARE
nr:hypothetical protein [Fortiea contorta]